MSTFCPLPWNHLATHPSGDATLCCVSDHTNNMSAAKTNGQFLNLNRNKIIEIVNSDLYVKTRQEMRMNLKPEPCLRCYKEEETNIQSKRQLELSRFGSDYQDNNGVIEPNLKFIELRLGNLCNAKCRTCNPMSSTQWITEYNKLQQELPFVTQYNNKIATDWTQSDEFWDDLLKNSNNVELIYINGGEPTLVEKHWNYLERLIANGLHKQVKLWYSINMTNLPDRLLDMWKHFKEVEVHCSIDDLYDRNSYIRRGTDWADVETNLAKLKKNDWIQSNITQTVSWMNIFYVPEFNEYFDKLGFYVQRNLVYSPEFYSIRILPSTVKQELQKKLGDHYLLDHVSSNENSLLFQQGLKYNNWLDKNREESFDKSFPEWSKILSK